MLHTSTPVLAAPSISAKSAISVRGSPGEPLELLPRLSGERRFELGEPGRVGIDERPVDQTALDHVLHRPFRKPTSPPALIWKNRSVIFVPNSADSTLRGTQ